MSDERRWTWALLIAAPLCCGGLAAFGASGLVALGAVAAWQGFAILAGTAMIAAAAVILVRRRRGSEP